MAQRKGLGKGLESLIPTGGKTPPVSSSAGGVQQVAVDAIQPNPRQPRIHFKEEDLAELAASIREHGVIQPLIVTPNGEGTFTLIAGERRWQASQKAGLRTVPVITRQANNQQMLEVALIENVQRADLNSMEEAEAYRQLVEEFGLSHEAVAKRVGKSRVAITNTLRLMSLADVVKQALVDGKITEGHARALLALSTQKAQSSALQTIINLAFNVRQTEEYIRKLAGNKPIKAKKPSRNADVNDVEKRLQHSLGTKVALKHGKKGGTVTIYYYSGEELDALLEKFNLMKKINFIFILLILSACTPQVTITSEIVTSTSFPTETPIPTPTLHPEFIVWQEIISAAGGRYTLTPDGSIQENGVAINDLQVDANGIMTLTVNEDKITLSPGEVTFGKDSIKIKDYELDDNGKWVPAVSEAMQGMKDSFAKYNILSWDGYTVVEQGENLEITDPETGKVVYKNGSFEPLFLGQLIVENGMCKVTPWSLPSVGPGTPSERRAFMDDYIQPLIDAYLLFIKKGIIPSSGMTGNTYYIGGNCWGNVFYNRENQPNAWFFWKDPNGKPLYEHVFLTPEMFQ